MTGTLTDKTCVAYAEQFLYVIENYPPTTLEGMTDWFISYFNNLYYFYYYVGLQVGVELMPMDWSIADDMLGFIRFARFEGHKGNNPD